MPILKNNNNGKEYVLAAQPFASGGRASVYFIERGIETTSPAFVAKVFPKPQLTSEELACIQNELGDETPASLLAVKAEQARLEAQKLENLRDGVVSEVRGFSALYTVKEYFETEQELVVIMEHLADTQELYDLPEDTPFATRVEIARQLTVSLHYLHSGASGKGILLHMDIKPENILVAKQLSQDMLLKARDSNLLEIGEAAKQDFVSITDAAIPRAARNVHIVDFNLSQGFEPDSQGSHYDQRIAVPATGTPQYVAPEVMLEQTASTKADIFSLGIVFFELFFLAAKQDHAIFHRTLSTGMKTPFEAVYTEDNYRETPRLSHMKDIDIVIKHFILRMLADNAQHRPNAEEVLQFCSLLHYLTVFAEHARYEKKNKMRVWMKIQKARLRLLAQGYWYTQLSPKVACLADLDLARYPGWLAALEITPLSRIETESSFSENARTWLLHCLRKAGARATVTPCSESLGPYAAPGSMRVDGAELGWHRRLLSFWRTKRLL